MKTMIEGCLVSDVTNVKSACCFQLCFIMTILDGSFDMHMFTYQCIHFILFYIQVRGLHQHWLDELFSPIFFGKLETSRYCSSIIKWSTQSNAKRNIYDIQEKQAEGRF